MSAHNNNNAVPDISDIRFKSDNIYCQGSLFCPDGAGKFPLIIMAHGLGGTRVMRLDAFARRFAEAGYMCMTFDYRHFGDSEGEPRQLLDINRQLDDWKAAIDFARTHPQVDSDKIILWGTSFSGGHVLTLASQDNDIAAVISQCPFTDGLASALALNPVNSIKLSLLGICDQISDWLGRKPVMVTTAGRPGETAMMNAADVYPGYIALMPENAPEHNYIAARIALNIIRYYPGRKTGKIQAPVLFCVCDQDSVAPAKATLRHAQRTKNKEIIRYPYGHFDIYVGDGFERVVNDQLTFLRKTVPLNTSSSAR